MSSQVDRSKPKFKRLSYDPTCLAIVQALHKNPSTIDELVSVVNAPATTIRLNLGKLKKGGGVEALPLVGVSQKQYHLTESGRAALKDLILRATDRVSAIRANP